MNNSSFFHYLSFLYNSTYMPIHLFCDGNLTRSFPEWGIFPEQFNIYRESIISRGVTLDYFITDDFLYGGIIRKPSDHIEVIIGPVSSLPLNTEMLDAIKKKYGFDDSLYFQVDEYFQRTPLFSQSQFLNIIGMINYELNCEIIDVYTYLSGLEYKSVEIAEQHSHSLIERKENENYHDTYYFEQEYYGYLERGDVNGILEFFKNVPSFTQGNVASDSIRQAKNIFITSIALATRHAIAGGLDIETAYELSDYYIQEVEKMSDATQITFLNGTAIIDFTKRVAESQIPMGMSKIIFQAIQYISNHVNKDISVQEIADELGVDRSTLSKKFTKELGFNISSYIMRRKLEEAKSLLHFTDKTISEISEYLCFSSQAYFQNVFKKKYGMTPREYRLKPQG